MVYISFISAIALGYDYQPAALGYVSAMTPGNDYLAQSRASCTDQSLAGTDGIDFIPASTRA